MVNVPDSLPARVFLLAYDTRRQRMTACNRLGFALRAAALTELYLDGRLTGDRRPESDTPGEDPYGLLAQISASRPRSWQYWVGKNHRAMLCTVREELARDGWIKVRRGRKLLIIPHQHVTVRDTRVVKDLGRRASSALRGQPVAHVNSYDAAVVALAAAARIHTVLSRADRRAHKRRISELSARTGPAVPALRRAIQTAEAVAAG